ncbi:MAG: DNA recombination protein RmuC [Patescibacteria group bacterium]
MSSNILTLIFGALFLLLNAFLLWFFLNRKREPEKKDDEGGLQLILTQLNELNRTMDSKLGESNKNIQTQFGQSFKIIQDVTERLTKLDETNRQVVNFADQLQSLQDILKNPKQRGVLGEYYLETLLKNTLPPGSYEVQYSLGKDENGAELKPDAVVFVKEKIIPIDSKFSLENYNKMIEEKNPADRERLEKLFVSDLKNRIVETSKYIQPSLGTMEFAFMFIPHEAIYYDLLVNKVGALKEETENLIQRAASKYKVIIVSPTSFLAYLQTVLQGLKALQIEEQAQEIIGRVGDLSKHIKAYEEYHGKLGNSLGTVVNHYNSSGKELRKIDKDFVKITGKSPGVAIPELERPDAEEA